jgi:hypothetical protein
VAFPVNLPWAHSCGCIQQVVDQGLHASVKTGMAKFALLPPKLFGSLHVMVMSGSYSKMEAPMQKNLADFCLHHTCKSHKQATELT